MTDTLYKVYCGTNGRWYTFKDPVKAKDMQLRLMERNYHTEMVVVPALPRREVKQLSFFES